MATRTLLLVALFAFAPSRLLAEEPGSGVASCAWVRAENDASGTGFLVDSRKRWLITCRHVVAERDKVDLFFPWMRDGVLVTDKSEYLGNRPLLRDRGLLVAGKVIKKNDAADLALVELESLPPGAVAIPFAANAVRSGDALRVVGHRLDLDTLFNATLGPVRQTGRLTGGYNWRGKKLAVNADAIIGQLPIEEGDSGGAVLNARGELVGMVSALRRQAPTAAVAISVAEIRKFLAIDEPKAKPEVAGIGDALTRATVWIRPMATDVHLAGVLFEKNLILTSSRGLGPLDRVGIAFPLFENGKFIGEREPYRDPVGLHLKGVWRPGVVLARDPTRDLAVIRVESVPETSRPLRLAEKLPAAGDAIHTMSHPSGLEFAWVYASGSIRQHGHVSLADGEKPAKAAVNLLQLPAQSGSPGGPIVNDRGEIVGVLSARESAQQTGYAATMDEIAAFLDVVLTDRPAKTIAGMIARMEAIRDRLAEGLAETLVSASSPFFEMGKAAEAERNYRIAIALDPDSHRARKDLMFLLLQSKRMEEFAIELDHLVDRPRCFPGHVFMRAVERMDRQEWRSARADLERILDVLPYDSLSRRRLIRVLLELNKDDEAVTAVGDTVRSQEAGLRFLAKDLLQQAEAMEKKFPGTPSVPASWLKRAIGAAHKSTTDPQRKAELEVVLKAAADAADDAGRLAILRGFLEKMTK